MSLRIRRGTDAQRSGIVFDLGEIVWTNDTEKLYVGDGITQGGKNIAAQLAGTGLQWNAVDQVLETEALSFNTDQITEGSNNKYFNVDRAQDAAASLFVTGTHVGLSFIYDDTTGKINASGLQNSDVASLFIDGLHSGITYQYQDNAINTIIDQSLIEANIAALFVNGTHIGITYQYQDDVLNSTVITSLVDDSQPQLGGDLNLDQYNITGTGNITIDGVYSGFEHILTELRFTDGFDERISLRSTTTGTLANAGLVLIQNCKGNVINSLETEPGDYVGGIAIDGLTVDGFKGAGYFLAKWDDDAVLTSSFPNSSFIIATGNNTNLDLNYFNFTSKGVFQAPILQATSYITSELPTLPEAGWIVFDSTIQKFKGYVSDVGLATIGVADGIPGWIDLN